MANPLPRPPVKQAIAGEDFLIDDAWQRWFNEIYNIIGASIVSAPSNSAYILQVADTVLTNAQVLATLSTGFAKVTTTTGVISTQATINSTDLTATGVAAATYGDHNHVPMITVNAAGQITSATNTTVTLDASAISGILPVINGGTGVTTSTGTGSTVLSTSPTFVTPILGVASATSLATSAASPLLLTNGQLATVALTSQTVGGTTLTIPDFASVADEFTFKTKSQTMSNKTFIAPALGTPASGVLTNCTGYTDANLSVSNITTNNVTTAAHGFAPILPNDATKYLDGTGAYTVPAGSTGEIILISTQNASGSTSIDFTSIAASSYNGYWIVLTNVLSAGNTGGLALRISIAVSFKSDGTYTDVAAMCRSGGVTSSGSTTDTQIFVTGTDAVGATAGTSEVSGIIFIPNCSQTTAPKRVTFQTMCKSQAGNNNATTGGGYYAANGAVDGFRILNNNHNLTSGTIALYGIKNS